MGSKYIIRKRENTILYFEFFLTAGIAAILLTVYLKTHPALGFVMYVAFLFLLWFLFFMFRIFRYFFSILFSLGWSGAAFWVGKAIDEKSTITAWVLGVVIFLFAIWAHWDHFTFLKEAKVYEYEKH
ncbi:MAG: hypothetical protein HYU71_12460 [Bacteroidetes bacterium]|nr:hypothetical protein [Bacteroidota bacterium]